VITRPVVLSTLRYSTQRNPTAGMICTCYTTAVYLVGACSNSLRALLYTCWLQHSDSPAQDAKFSQYDWVVTALKNHFFCSAFWQSYSLQWCLCFSNQLSCRPATLNQTRVPDSVILEIQTCHYPGLHTTRQTKMDLRGWNFCLQDKKKDWAVVWRSLRATFWITSSLL